jgi:putative acyl-CoA dehydrogenase
MMLAATTEQGHGCPISMTYSAVPALARQPELLAEWQPRIASLEYDPRSLPAAQKKGVLFGMAMTEKQGGSDVRANTTRAEPLGARGPGNEYAITGHKWFCSAPMNDAFLVLAQAQGGLSCFLLPRWKPDETRNAFQIQRLKDKCGNRSNASSEVEFRAAWARLVGEEGRGVQTILEMVNHTRLDCVLGAAGMMRACLMNAAHHASHRAAFGKRLGDQPLMRAVLTDLALESEAATVLSLRLARAYDDAGEAPFRRIATAISKYWVCKRVAPFAAEALECLGGNGFVEEAPMARLYREAPLNSVWEGSGNVICLDVLRALGKEPQSVAALVGELRLARGADKRLDLHREELENDLAPGRPGLLDESQARVVVERLALALQGSLLVRHSPAAVAEAFCATRLAGSWGRSFGTLPKGVDTQAILARAWPALA